MQGLADLWIFAGALAVAYLVPGPDMVLIFQTGALEGRGRAFAVAVGLAVARALHVLLAAIGLATLLRTSPWVFDIVRLAGAAYLIWLGIGIIRTQSLWLIVTAVQPEQTGRSWFTAARRGLLTNVLNPKALLFCSVLLPQFIREEYGSILTQFFFLGWIVVAVGFVFDLIYAGGGAALGRWLDRHPLAQTLQRWVFASLLVGLGFRLALAPRPT